MATLAVVPSLPVHFTAPDEVLLTHKFVDGMTRYASLWDGPVISVMHPHTGMSTGNLDDAVFKRDQLPFEVRSAPFGEAALFAALADADVVMLGGDHRLNSLTRWCHSRGKKTVFVTEYTLQTRLQIVNAEQRNPLIKMRKYIWEWQQERRNRQAVAAADAVQCNGTPTYEAYRRLNDNTLLFFDSRVSADMLVQPDELAERQALLRNAAPLRLAYSGRLNAMKGADDVIEVARHLLAARQPFRLDVFGDGPLRPAMQQKIKDYKLEQQVRLHGVVDYATELLPHIRNNVDLFICCHRQGDPSCTYLETLACGVPVAGYANEALSGMLAYSPAGWVTPMQQPEQLAQQIVALAGRPEQLVAAGSAALTFAREHTFEHEFSARINQISRLLEHG